MQKTHLKPLEVTAGIKKRKYNASKLLKNYKPEKTDEMHLLTFGELLAACQDELKQTKNLLKLVANGAK